MNSSNQVVEIGKWYRLDLIQRKDNGEVHRDVDFE